MQRIHTFAFMLVLAASPQSHAVNRDRLCQALPEGNTCTREDNNGTSHLPQNSVVDSEEKLTLRIANGKVVSLKNRQSNGEGWLKYIYKQYLQRSGHYVIYQQRWESGSHIFINRETGKLTSIQVILLRFSPDGSHFLAFTLPDHPDDSSAGIGLYSIDENGYRLVNKFTYAEASGNEWVWVTPDQIAIFIVERRDNGRTIVPVLRSRLKRLSDTWILSREVSK